VKPPYKVDPTIYPEFGWMNLDNRKVEITWPAPPDWKKRHPPSRSKTFKPGISKEELYRALLLWAKNGVECVHEIRRQRGIAPDPHAYNKICENIRRNKENREHRELLENGTVGIYA
jgi:hypothetical protein